MQTQQASDEAGTLSGASRADVPHMALQRIRVMAISCRQWCPNACPPASAVPWRHARTAHLLQHLLDLPRADVAIVSAGDDPVEHACGACELVPEPRQRRRHDICTEEEGRS